jgi:hypothetical protein
MEISQQANMVRLVNMVDCKDLNNGANLLSYMEFGEQAWNNNGEKDLGIHSTVQTNKIVYTVTGHMTETWFREELTKLAGELMQITNLDRTKVCRRGWKSMKLVKKGIEIKRKCFLDESRS